MILFNDCRLCKECSKVRNGAMRSDVQTKVSEDVILGALQIWWYDFVATVGWWNVFSWRWYIYGTRSWNKDKYESPQELPLGPFKTWGPSSQSIQTFQASFTHYNLFLFFFSQSITGASIIYNPIFCFLLDPPPTPEKALKTTDSPIFPGELSQFDMDALKSVPRKQGHSLYPRWISLNRKIWLSNLLASMVTLYFFTVWCVQSWDEKIFFGEKLQF